MSLPHHLRHQFAHDKKMLNRIVNETTVTLEEMQKIREEHHCTGDAPFCGYLRQPISVSDYTGGCRVSGYCALRSSYCTKDVSDYSRDFIADSCRYYVLQFGEGATLNGSRKG